MKEPSIKKNYAYNIVFQLFNMITPLITAPYTARVLGADGIGLQSYIASIAAFFVLIAALGTASYGQREVALCRNEKMAVSQVFSDLVFIRLVTTLVSLLGWIILTLRSQNDGLYYAVSTIYIIGGFLDVSWLYAGLENFRIIVVRNFFVKVICIILLFLFVKNKDGLIIYVGLIAISAFAGNLSMWLGLKKYIIFVKPNFSSMKKHFKETMVFFVPTISIYVYNVFDKTMLGIITRDPYENGYYEQASKLVFMAKSIVLSLNTVMYTRMSYLFKEGRYEEMRRRLHTSISIILTISIPMSAGMMAIAKTFIPWFFGIGYEKVVMLLYIYMPLVPVIGLSNCLGQQYLTPVGLRGKCNKVIIGGAFANLIINMILIPQYGSYGATIASVVAEFIILLLFIRISVSQLNMKRVGKQLIKNVITSAIMFFCIYNLNGQFCNSIINLFVQIFVGIAVYVLLTIVMKNECIEIIKPMLFHRIPLRRKGKTN